MVEILVVPKDEFPLLPDAGTWPIDSWPSRHAWLKRNAAETNESWLQLIPYVLLTGNRGNIWCYQRSGGDSRLNGSYSCGVGGHVERCDECSSLMATIMTAAMRELREEIINADSFVSDLNPIAYLYEGRSAIGRVHLGIIFIAHCHEDAPLSIADGENLQPLGFRQASSIIKDPHFELWSRLAAALHDQQP